MSCDHAFKFYAPVFHDKFTSSCITLLPSCTVNGLGMADTMAAKVNVVEFYSGIGGMHYAIDGKT